MPLVTNHEEEPRDVEVFAVVDIDRTLLDTERLLNLFYDDFKSENHSHPLGEDELNELKENIKDQTGNSLDFLQFIEGLYGDRLDIEAAVERVVSKVKAGDAAALLYDGSEDLLQALSLAGAGVGLYTYGTERTQSVKVRILRAASSFMRDLPIVIESSDINEIHKPDRAIDKWYDEESDLFDVSHFEGYGKAEKLLFIDDKAKNLPPLRAHNQNMLGILVNNRPGSGRTIKDLVDIVKNSNKTLDVVAHEWVDRQPVEKTANL